MYKNKKGTINPTNKKNNKCFQYNVTVTLNHEWIKDLQRISKIKPFIVKSNWERSNYQSTKKSDWKKFEKNNLTTALNVLYAKKENIYPVYVSKHN